MYLESAKNQDCKGQNNNNSPRPQKKRSLINIIFLFKYLSLHLWWLENKQKFIVNVKV